MPNLLRARQARPAGAAWNLTKTVVQTAAFWSVFLFLIPAGIVNWEDSVGIERRANPIAQGIGVGVFALAGMLGLSSAALVAVKGRGTPLPNDCPRELVVVGPYRYIRNPMAVAGLAQGFGVGLFLGSPAVIVYALLGGPVWHLLVRPWEEADLERRFGDSYRAYRARVRCWLPRFRR